MDSLLLDGLDAESLELLIEHLTEVHRDGLVYLLPQMGSEDLDERDLERRNLSVQKDTGEIELDLETNVDVRTVDGRRPPKSKAAVGDLVETGTLGVRELLELHGLFKTYYTISIRSLRACSPQRTTCFFPSTKLVYISHAIRYRNTHQKRPSQLGKAVALKSY
jgi:hypothetical protein